MNILDILLKCVKWKGHIDKSRILGDSLLAANVYELDGCIQYEVESSGHHVFVLEGPIYYELLKPGETVNTDRYKQQLLNLNDVILEKREQYKERQHKVIFLDDNASSHRAKPAKDIELEISVEPPRRIRIKHIFDNGSKDVQLTYEDDLKRTMFFSQKTE
ncbi:mariner Mos1 transposase [Trichonephila clavipes]|nr:mariner Mos1 transposase [Trichonephila clavipes]